MSDKPTEHELKELLEKERANIRELFASPLGQEFGRWLRRLQSMPRLFDKDPYVMAYRCAIHDVISSILDAGDPRNG